MSNCEWQEMIGGPLSIGIGLNTGPTMTGNTGSKHKFKYGPLGHTVNLASRVEGATKQFHIPALITGSTRALLGDSFATRRLCKVRVGGIAGAVDLYELYAVEAVGKEAKEMTVGTLLNAATNSSAWGISKAGFTP